jgi:hypothetical protein
MTCSSRSLSSPRSGPADGNAPLPNKAKSSLRECTPNLSKMTRTCLAIVPAERFRIRAIARFERPRCISERISRSVSLSRGLTGDDPESGRLDRPGAPAFGLLGSGKIGDCTEVASRELPRQRLHRPTGLRAGQRSDSAKLVPTGTGTETSIAPRPSIGTATNRMLRRSRSATVWCCGTLAPGRRRCTTASRPPHRRDRLGVPAAAGAPSDGRGNE